MKYRHHRAMLEDSMKTVVDIPATLKAVRQTVGLVHPLSTTDVIEVKPYNIHDSRIGWDTHIVTLNGCAVGYTDGPLTE